MTKKNNKVEELEQKVAELDNQLKRAVADYQNLEKRVSEGRSELTKWGTNELIKKLLPVMDNLLMAIAGAQQAGESSGWLQGARLSVLELKKVLEGEGVEFIEPIKLSDFDPNIHEAVDVRDGENGKIIECMRFGYKLKGDLLRPAQVVVGQRHSGEEQSDDSRIDSGQARMTEGDK